MNTEHLQDLIDNLQIEHVQTAIDNIQASHSDKYNDFFYWLRDDQNIPFYNHIAALRLGKKILSSEAPRPNIIWDSNNEYEGLTCNGIHFSLAKLRRLVSDLLNLAHGILVNKVLFGSSLPKLLDQKTPMKTVFKDNIQNAQFGYSFHNDRSNLPLTKEENRKYVLDIINNNTVLNRKFFGGDGTSANPVAFGKWMKDVGEFVKIMALLIELFLKFINKNTI